MRNPAGSADCERPETPAPNLGTRQARLGAHDPSMEPLTVLLVAGATLVTSGVLVATLPVQHCDECAHCRQLKQDHELEQRRLRAEYARQWGLRTKDGDEHSYRDDDR